MLRYKHEEANYCICSFIIGTLLFLAATTNYPGWIKGVYPVREDAVAGVNDETLYVARYDGRIVGSVSTLLFLTNRVFDLPF